MYRPTTRLLLTALLLSQLTQHAQAIEPTEAEAALHRSVRFFRENASAGGGYVYRLSADLSKREGEGAVGPTVAWIQPPATPSVGQAYLRAYRFTGDPLLKEAAVETGMALVRGQLASGGWDNRIEFDPERRRRYDYRVDGDGGRSNVTTFDDDKSQSALRFLMQVDHQLDQQNGAIHEAAQFAIESFLKAQYPNGAWPQRYRDFPDPADFPVLRASYPEGWSRTFPDIGYQDYYTLNDNTISDLIETMLLAYDIYGDERCLAAARRGGDFLCMAQMPEPQPGWAQQYNREMQPAWARKFEPPAITGGESQGVMQTLLLLYRRTGDERFLEPIPRALRYYRSSLRPDGRLARFYELHTNRPLYFTRQYELTYSDEDMPTHYAFITGSRLDRIEDEFTRLRNRPTESPADAETAGRRTIPTEYDPPELTPRLQRRAAEVIAGLDERGAWVEEGRLRYHEDDDTTHVIESRTFIDHLAILSEFIAAGRARR